MENDNSSLFRSATEAVLLGWSLCNIGKATVGYTGYVGGGLGIPDGRSGTTKLFYPHTVRSRENREKNSVKSNASWTGV